MYLKQLAAFGMSAVMVLSGGVVASGAETKTTVDTVTPQEYTTAVEKLAAWHRNPAFWTARTPCL